MLNIYCILLLVFGITIPILIHEPLKKRIKSSSALLITQILAGVTILFAGITLPFYMFFSMPDYPKITRKIDEHYYFTQQEYGWAGGMPGKHLEFFESNTLWFDKKIGHIQWQIGTGDFSGKIMNTSSKNNKRIILTENDKLVLDTTLSFDKKFDFKYLSRR